MEPTSVIKAWADREAAVKERDALKIEVYRLNAEIGRIMAGNMARLTEARCEKEAYVGGMATRIVARVQFKLDGLDGYEGCTEAGAFALMTAAAALRDVLAIIGEESGLPIEGEVKS